KDIGGLHGIGGNAERLLGALLASAGAAAPALAALAGLDLPPKAAAMVGELAALVEDFVARGSRLSLTVDLGEYRGFAYQHGFGFAIYARGARGELGRGGRYAIRRADGAMEPATGLTLYMDSVSGAASAPAPAPRVLLGADAPADLALSLQGQGYVTVRALDGFADPAAEARRLRCSHVWQAGTVKAVVK
ncbi:MAG: ATP phosphoribosyltransferase regulatory subunit, partial [Alphaproteobacteria bacterium]